MRVLWRRRLAALLAVSAAAMALTPQLSAVARVPEVLRLRPGEAAALPAASMLRARLEDGGGAVASVDRREDGRHWLTADGEGEARLTYRLLDLLPVRTVDVRVGGARRLIPGGGSVGVAIDTRGVVVVGASDLSGTPSPARVAGIRSGDIIQGVNGVGVDSAAALSAAIGSGDPVRLDILRRGEARSCVVRPALDARDGSWRLGAWVRDSTAGVGTLTFVDPATGIFGALGHAITDADTGVVMPVGAGELYSNSVVGVSPSRSGAPGELTGDFVSTANAVGTVALNAEEGIYGRYDAAPEGPYPNGLPAAERSALHPGPASLLTTLDGREIGEYACEIVRVNDGGAGLRAMVVRVTDPRLLGRAGGIVQGMSGSPILQDGALAGALTHVMVNDPAMGYGISIQDMLEAADDLSAARAEAA